MTGGYVVGGWGYVYAAYLAKADLERVNRAPAPSPDS